MMFAGKKKAEPDRSRAMMTIKIAQELIDERSRQVIKERFNTAHDDEYRNGELERAAATYAFSAGLIGEARNWLVWDHKPPRPPEQVRMVEMLRLLWPCDMRWWKPRDRRRDLVRAGALIIAAIERLDRNPARPHPRDSEWRL